MAKCLLPMICVLLTCSSYAAGSEPSDPITWADDHPEVVANNARPTIAWPCEKIETDLGYCHQPSVVIDSSGELYAEGSKGRIFHSVDRGRTWSRLCSVPPLWEMPEGMKVISPRQMMGLGVSPSGALLGFWFCAYSKYGETETWPTSLGVDDVTLDYALWVTRSEDRGQTWTASAPFEGPPGVKVGSGKMRMAVMPDGRLMISANAHQQSRPDRPVTRVEQLHHGYVYVSDDDGRSWSREGFIGNYSFETDLLPVPSGRILAAVRYQRRKYPSDPPQLVSPWDNSPEPGGHSIIKNTALAFSEDGGATWSAPRIVTGFMRTPGCLVRLSDGTLLMPHGVKEGLGGQRFVVSYDEGQTWSNAIFELNDAGYFASTVALDDDTLVTVHETPRGANPNNWVMLHVLRWKAPPRSEVEKHGFFEPRQPEWE